MKPTILALGLICFASLGCGDDTAPATTPDLSVAADLSVTHDLTPNADLTSQATCAQTLSCITACTSGNINTCVPACLAALSTSGATYFNALQACAQPACYAQDGGTPPCADPSSTACTNCIAGQCSSQIAACEAH